MCFRSATALACLLFAAGACAESPVTVYRCVDNKGAVSLQDDPCPKGSIQGTRQMQRPVDAPAKPATIAPTPTPTPAPAPVVDASPTRADFVPAPPPLYRCTSYDGVTRESEVYDPNPRCEPLALYYPNPRYLTPAQAGACRWVQDSCVRLDDETACAVFKKKREEAVSSALHAFSDTAAYRKSELQRLTQIVEERCR